MAIPATPWAQQQLADFLKQQAMDQKIKHVQQQLAMDKAYQQQAQMNQIYQMSNTTAATSTFTNVGIINTGTAGTSNQMATYSGLSSGIQGGSISSQQAYWGARSYEEQMARRSYEQVDEEIEALLQRKLRRERKILIEHRRHMVRRANWFHKLEPMMPVAAMDVKTVEGYRLPENHTYVLPDGATLILDEHGNYGIHDEDAKVVYRACRKREFNPYLNASDLLVGFVKEVGAIDGVRQDEVLTLPIEAFINWLVLQAATKDGDPVDKLPKVADALKPRMLAAPKPDEIHEEFNLEQDCLVRKEIFIKRIPRQALEDRAA